MKRPWITVASVAALLGVTACGSEQASTPALVRATAPRVPAAPPMDAGATMSTFGARILLADKGIGLHSNGSISPYSIYSALAMTRAGAHGDTATELDALLGGDAARQAGVITAIDAQIARPDGATVQAANVIWPDKALDVRPAYLKALASGYDAGVCPTDLRGDPNGSRQDINRWVSDKTHKLIPELLPEGAVSADTAAVLVNALYLKGDWATPLNKPSGAETFTTSQGEARQVPMMHKAIPAPYADGDGWTSITLPVKGNRLGMTIVLPDKGTYAALRARLGDVLPKALATKLAGNVQLAMPAFELETKAELKPTLEALGARAVFDEQRADLSGVAGKPGELFVKRVDHQSVVKVGPDGVEAAAATAVGMEVTGAPAVRQTVTVDRAFFFVIHDLQTKAPLFLGQVTDPTAHEG